MNLTHLLSELLLGMSQKEIAKAIGASQPTISRVKRGKQNINHEYGKRLEQLAVSKGIPVQNLK